MAIFTKRLKDVLGHPYDLDACYDNAALIGLGDYPIFDEAHRGPLNRKIIDHFLNREIGQETEEMFSHAMRRRMNEIMPTFNQLYVSERIKIDPLLTMDIKSVSDSETVSTAENANTNKSTAVSYDMPQNRLKGDRDYASGAQDVGAEGTGTSSNNDSGKVSSRTTGIQGSQVQMLIEYRSSFLNVDLAIIEEIEASNLFSLLWGNNDNAFSRNNSFSPFGGYYGSF